MPKQVLYPVDTANFKRIREMGFIYVDKTAYIHQMLQEGGQFYFMARPRRFGKSLYLDTLAEYFQGNRKLFKSLDIDRLQPEEWESYPVLRFNMTGAAFNTPDALLHLLEASIRRQEEGFGIEKKSDAVGERFKDLIFNLSVKTREKVVILIDEYDAPLSSAIGKPELQEIYRDQLHGFYSILKNCDAYIRFCMLTGVTRYGKVSVFSGLNNLKDITFDDNYAGICGITEEELHKYYQEGAKALALKEGITEDEAFGLLKFNYDGYHFSKCLLDVYNPFSINYALQGLEIKDYWCQSGMPTLLSKSLSDIDFDINLLRDSEVSISKLTNLSLTKSDPIPLFYQTGYLTIKEYDSENQSFKLGYPNREVEKGILDNILSYYVPDSNDVGVSIARMKRSLREGEPEKFIELLNSYLAGIPHQLREDVAKYENYYHTIFYCIVKLIGLNIQAEYSTSKGFIDILIQTDKYIYVIELKINGTAKSALNQIEKNQYVAQFATDPRKLFKIGIGFSKKTNTVKSLIVT